MARRRASNRSPRPSRDSQTLFGSVVDAVTIRSGTTRAADSAPTGFPSVDQLLGGGLRREDLIVVGGDVGSGKSALALAMAGRVAELGRAVVFYAGEVSPQRVAERVVAIEGRARVDDLRRGALDEKTRGGVAAAVARLRAIPLTIRHAARTVPELADDLTGRSCDLAVIDTLQMLAPGRLPLDEELAAAVRELKRLAVERGVALLVTAHLPNLTERSDRRPQLDDFGARGAVKQHADVVLGLFREGMYEPARSVDGATELHVLKNRNGATAYADLYFYAQWMRFEDLVEPDR